MSQAHDFAGILGEFVQRSGYNVCQLARLTLLRALDDPFFANDIPRQTIAQNPHLYAGFVAHGGHVAFVEGGVVWFLGGAAGGAVFGALFAGGWGVRG